MGKDDPLDYHERPEAFRQAIDFTEASMRFNARLVEKDYYCSLILRQLDEAFRHGLVFKGGTSLSKVHTDFYRLSEDLDFVISMETDALRSVRRKRIAALKELIDGLPERLAGVQLTEPLGGHQQSRQYIGRLSYASVVTGQAEFITVEISLREPVLDAVERQPARTMLADPLRTRPLDPITVSVLSFRETFAEKFRAAMTRRDPAIRDYYDIDYAVRSGKLDPSEESLLELLRRKLAVPGNEPINVSSARFSALQRQIESQLRPVLRAGDTEEFDLRRVFEIVTTIAARLQSG